MKIERFEEIQGWQHARKLSRMVYAVVTEGAFSRDFGLRDQITRAAGSAMDNIAEGFDSESNAEFVRFLRYAQRSCSEVQSQLYRALDQTYLNQDSFDALYHQATETRKTIRGFIRYLKSNPKPPN